MSGAPALTLFLTSTAIWGSTWLVITFQLGRVAPEVSVAYRFALAAALLLGWCAATGRSLRLAAAQHALLACQGVLLFGANYVLVYVAEQHVASGLVAVLFSLIVFLNMAGARVFFGTPIAGRVALAAALGVCGVGLLFAPEIARSARSTGVWTGVACGLVSTVLASGGNLLAIRARDAGIALAPGTGWAMLYGALGVAAWVAATGTPWTFDPRPAYVVSLLALAVFGSVVAFLAYLTLVGRIGPARAGYIGIAVPVVAMLLSTLFEGYRWTPAALAGLAMCLAGNVLVLAPGTGPDAGVSSARS